MAAFRINKNKENPYFMLDKEFLNDNRLSWKAKGLLAYLLSLSDDWGLFEDELVKQSKDDINSTREAMKELIEHGYIEKK